jgi:hypothetical protein
VVFRRRSAVAVSSCSRTSRCVSRARARNEVLSADFHIHQIVFIVLSAAGLLLPVRDMIGAGRPPGRAFGGLRIREAPSCVSRARARKDVLFADLQDRRC